MPSDVEPLIPDVRVRRIAERLMLQYPDLPNSTQFVTARRGEQFQFVVFCDYPRKWLADQGQKLAKTATGQVVGWEEAESERGHFVTGSSEDPAYPVFRALAWDLLLSVRNIQEIMN